VHGPKSQFLPSSFEAVILNEVKDPCISSLFFFVSDKGTSTLTFALKQKCRKSKAILELSSMRIRGRFTTSSPKKAAANQAAAFVFYSLFPTPYSLSYFFFPIR
jgi:hypothetical protein